jgi:iron(III) transport system ATP-binding protein
MTLSDQIVVMNQGKIEQIGSPTEVYRRPATRFVADFIGQANFIEATVRDRRDGHLVLDALGTTLIALTPAAEIAPGAAATLVIRPEMVEMDSPQAQVAGIVRRSAYLGNVIEYDVEVGGQLLSLVERDPRHLEIHPEGQAVKVRFLEDCLYVLPK